MRRVIFAILAVLVLLIPSLVPTPGSAADGCQFILGFKALHDAIPDKVGTCTSGESHNPINGDGLQNTTAWHGKGGLLVWRKADNWTAFTDGGNTWINGPNGVQMRSNSERFAWERDGVPSTRANVAAYLYWFVGNSNAMSQALNDMGLQMSLAGTSPERFLTDPLWRAKTATILAQLKALGISMQKYPDQLPGDCAALQAIFASLGQDMVYVADETAAGIGGMDPQRVNNASARLKTIDAKANQMVAAITALKAKWGG